MPNLQYPGDPALEKLLMTREFRIALSLAIDRDLINRLCYDGTGRITAMKLHPSAPDYVELTHAPNYAVYDPERARALLDSIGLDQRDADGYRLGLDGKTVSLIMELATVVGPDMDAVEIVRSQWEAVGIKTALKPEERTLYFQRVAQNGEHMIGVQGAEATFPLLSSARWFSTSLWCEWGHHWARWHLSGGERGIEPPPEVKRLQQLQAILSVTVDADERKRLWQEVMRNHAENLWVIPLVSQATSIGVVSNDFGNVSERGVASWVAMTPGYLTPETFYSKSARALTTMDGR
jgi:peptide/nickel transport system substrate-binding protein